MPSFDVLLPPQPYARWQPVRSAGEHPTAPIPAGLRLIAEWIERVRERQALATLDERMLRDIGVTRAEAVRECEKPFWR